jgi:nitroreductase
MTTLDMRREAAVGDGAEELHPLLSGRRSPRAFDDTHDLSRGELRRILEAARWASSSLNRQPWRFLVAARGDSRHERVLTTLGGANPAWAPRASALLVGVIDTRHDRPTTAAYGLGLAVAQLVVQAEHEGLRARQMGGFDKARLAHELKIPDGFEPFVVVAVGREAGASVLPEELAAREHAPRERRAIDDTVFADWGVPYFGAAAA